MAKLNFHVRHEVNPERVWAVLDALINGYKYDHITQYDRQVSRLRQLDLVTKQGDVAPTDLGLEIHRIGTGRLELTWEILHYIHYAKWNAQKPTNDTMFYTYRRYCDLLYSMHEVDVVSQRDKLAAEMEGLVTSSEYFSEELSKLAKGAVSLSGNSLIGVEHWLAKLSPEVLTAEGSFALRFYCPPELLVMALGYVTLMTDAEIGLEQQLSHERRELLCRICLIEDSALDQILDWTYPEYPELVQPGTQSGSYGRFIRVLKIPTLKDLIP